MLYSTKNMRDVFQIVNVQENLPVAAVQRPGRDLLYSVHPSPVRRQHGQILRHRERPSPIPGILDSVATARFPPPVFLQPSDPLNIQPLSTFYHS
jgi:hypothetical protein